MGSTHGKAPAGFAPIAIGLGLTLIHLISIPVTNTSVNPARSTGPALFVGGWALAQLWLFWVAPLIGGAHRRLALSLAQFRAVGRRDGRPGQDQTLILLASARGPAGRCGRIWRGRREALSARYERPQTLTCGAVGSRVFSHPKSKISRKSARGPTASFRGRWSCTGPLASRRIISRNRGRLPGSGLARGLARSASGGTGRAPLMRRCWPRQAKNDRPSLRQVFTGPGRARASRPAPRMVRPEIFGGQSTARQQGSG